MSRTHERAYGLLAERVRLGATARWWLYAIATLLVASGGGWIVVHYADILLSGRTDELTRIAGEALALKLHGVAAFATLVAFGAMLATHALRGWALRRNRRSGSVIIAVLVVLTVTGYALYYLVDELTRPPVSLLHWALGLVFVPALVVHIALGRRSRRSARRVLAKP
jgi:hypothetical protein